MWPAMYGVPAAFGYGEVPPPARSRRRDRSDSSDSRDRQRDKRKRESGGGGDERRDKKDKKSKKEKRSEKDRREDGVILIDDDDRRAPRRQDPLAGAPIPPSNEMPPRRQPDVGRQQPPSTPQQQRGAVGGAEKEKEREKEKDPLQIGSADGASERRRAAGSPAQPPAKGAEPENLSAGKPSRPAASPAQPRAKDKDARAKDKDRDKDKDKDAEPETPSAGTAKSKRWRQEVEEEDERDLSDDDEAMEKKLAEAKRRREAIMAKSKKGAQGDEDEANAAAKVEAKAAEAKTKAAETEAEAKAAAATEETNTKSDMFDESAEASAALKKGERYRSQNIGLTGASGDDWDDEEGYYIPKIGEVMGDRYLVVEVSCGRGVFSNVVKAKDQQAGGEEGLVAIKVMRNNSMMTKAAEKEVAILEKLNSADKRNKRHIIRLHATFAYRKHFCLVFECMHDDLRGMLKKHTKNKGMSLTPLRSYTQQLLLALHHMREHGIIHADIKPDNILVSKGHNTVKICDLGTALELKDVMASPYLASRFYRPPEVILGCDFSYGVDTWALGCALFELFTGRTLLNSKSNNDHLKKIMELRGKVPGKVIKKGAVWKTHFTDELDFKHMVEDPGSGQQVIKTVTDFTQKGSLKELILDRVGKEKQQSTEKEDQLYVKRAAQFADLLEQLLALDPDKRARPDEALHHPFLQDKISAASTKEAESKKR